MVKERIRIGFLEPSNVLIGDQSFSSPPFLTCSRQRAPGRLAILLYLINNAFRLDEGPFLLCQHWHINIAAPTENRAGHCCSSSSSTTATSGRYAPKIGPGYLRYELINIANLWTKSKSLIRITWDISSIASLTGCSAVLCKDATPSRGERPLRFVHPGDYEQFMENPRPNTEI